MLKALCIIIGTFGPAKECQKNLELDKHLTSISASTLKEVLKQSHIQLFGVPASINRINMAWAQIALENGRGRFVYNYNLGNIGTHATKYIRPFYKVATSRFRSFLSFKEGAKAYWQLLYNNCPITLKVFDTGDVKASAISLKRCNYYEADLDFYYHNMRSLFVQANKL